MPRLPRKVQLHVAKCHACHAKSRGDHGGTWEPSVPPEPARHTYHACHVKRRWMSQSATPATQSAATCRQVPRLPRKVQLHVAKNKLCDEKLFTSCVSKFYACHVKRRWMSQSATPATQSAATCRQVPRLPRKKPRRPRRHVGTQRATRASPVPYVPRLPRKVTIHVAKCHACVSKLYVCQVPHLPCKVQLHVAKNKLCDETVHKLCVQVPRLPRDTKVDVSKCHACHAKCSYMSPSATPATQKAAATTAARGNPARHQSQPSAIRATPATQSDDPCRQEQVV